MIRVILDANVLISAALGRDDRSPSRRLLEAATDDRMEALTCPKLLAEVGSVLARDRLRRYLSLEEALNFLGDLATLTTLVSDPAEPYPAVCRDPADDYLLALARSTTSTHSAAAIATFSTCRPATSRSSPHAR